MSFFNKIFSDFLKSKTEDLNQDRLGGNRKKLHEYYKNKIYKIIPVIPSEEESQRILENMASFPGSEVAKEYMIRLDNGLLRGDIILLWWLDNPRTKKNKIPQYFLYAYGIDAEKHLLELNKQGHIDSDRKLTVLGKDTLVKYNQVVREHQAVSTRDSDGNLIYLFSDEQAAEEMGEFKSSGNAVEDQFIGKAFEKAKDYDNAIKAYQSAYKLALKDELFKDSPPPNIFSRLAIIYRKLKQYDKEIAILKEALKYYEDGEFADRLEKAKALLERSGN